VTVPVANDDRDRAALVPDPSRKQTAAALWSATLQPWTLSRHQEMRSVIAGSPPAALTSMAIWPRW
jgi:hypothetical protein